jgi:hypothetical protein
MPNFIAFKQMEGLQQMPSTSKDQTHADTTQFSECAVEDISHSTKLLLDHNIYTILNRSNVVRSQSEFSQLCGKCSSYFSALQSKQIPISVAALVRLNLNVRRMAEAASSSTRRRQLLLQMSGLLETEICSRAS